MQCFSAVELSRLVKIPRECKRNVHLRLSWRARWINAEICSTVVKLSVFTFDLVNDGAIELGVRSCQVLQVPVGWYLVRFPDPLHEVTLKSVGESD